MKYYVMTNGNDIIVVEESQIKHHKSIGFIHTGPAFTTYDHAEYMAERLEKI